MARSESGSIQKLGPNRWRVRVSGGNDPVTGKRIRKTKVVHGSKKDAIAERTRMQVEVGNVGRATADMTLAQYLEDMFLPWQETRIRANSYYNECRTARSYIIPALGHIKLTKLSAYTIETWAASLPTDCSRHSAFCLLRHAMRQAYRWDMVPRNIFDKLDTPSYSPKPKTVADADLGGLILGMLRGTEIEAPILLQLSCGMRLSEAMAVDWEDIDWRAGKVRVWRNYQVVPGKGGVFFEPKTRGSERTVSIPAGALRRLHEIRTEGGVIRSGPLAVGRDGERMKPDSLRYRYHKLYDRELPGQPYVTLKNLRHSHATILLAQGVDLKTIADRLGHTNIGTTARSYVQHVDELDVRASEAFDSAFFVASPVEDDDGGVVGFRAASGA